MGIYFGLNQFSYQLENRPLYRQVARLCSMCELVDAIIGVKVGKNAC